jgi:hypothetical protein
VQMVHTNQLLASLAVGAGDVDGIIVDGAVAFGTGLDRAGNRFDIGATTQCACDKAVFTEQMLGPNHNAISVGACEKYCNPDLLTFSDFSEEVAGTGLDWAVNCFDIDAISACACDTGADSRPYWLNKDCPTATKMSN